MLTLCYLPIKKGEHLKSLGALQRGLHNQVLLRLHVLHPLGHLHHPLTNCPPLFRPADHIRPHSSHMNEDVYGLCSVMPTLSRARGFRLLGALFCVAWNVGFIFVFLLFYLIRCLSSILREELVSVVKVINVSCSFVWLTGQTTSTLLSCTHSDFQRTKRQVLSLDRQ